MTYATLNEAFQVSSFITNKNNSKKSKEKHVTKKRQQEYFSDSDSDSDSDVENIIETFKNEYEHQTDNFKNNNNNSTEEKLSKMEQQIDTILKKLNGKNIQNTLFDKNMHDIILFIIFGLFIVLLLESLFKLANKK